MADRVKKRWREGQRQRDRLLSQPTWLVASFSAAILSGAALWIAELEDKDSIRSVAKTLFDRAEAIAIVTGVVIFLNEAPNRRAEKHYKAWQVIDSAAAAGTAISHARNKALEDLCRDRVNLLRISLPKADLMGIELSEAMLHQADLRMANLHYARLNGADLSCADLRGANLRDAHLEGADLTRADLTGASLSCTGLSNVNLEGANLSCADLSFVNYWDECNLKGAIYTEGEYPQGPIKRDTIWPYEDDPDMESLDPEKLGMVRYTKSR